MTTQILTYEKAKRLAIYCFYYSKIAYEYKTEDGTCHLIINEKDVLKGKKATYCFYYSKIAYKYQTKDGTCHTIKI